MEVSNLKDLDTMCGGGIVLRYGFIGFWKEVRVCLGLSWCCAGVGW